MPKPIKVTLKLATSLDGRIATATGESKWITGELAREQGHRLRAAHDAILVGVETVLADDPELTVRFLKPFPSADGGRVGMGVMSFQDETQVGDKAANAVTPNPGPSPIKGEGGDERQPLRVVLDSRLRTPTTAKLAAANTLILTAVAPHPVGAAEVRQVAAENGRPAISAVLAALDERGVGSVLIEGGGQVAASFLSANAVDAIEWFRAPILLGAEGRPCVAGLALANLAAAPKFRRLSVEPVGDDLWERYERL